MSILSSPIWRAKSFITQVNPANSPTLWSFDGNGFASPSDGRPITAPEQAWMDDYNAQRALMNEATRPNNGVRSCLLPFNLKYPPCPDPYVLNSPVLYTT